jgi:hypothetical protein
MSWNRYFSPHFSLTNTESQYKLKITGNNFRKKLINREKFMKKISMIFAIALILAFAGCESTGGGKASEGGDLEPFIVDLSTLSAVRNATPFTKNWDDFYIRLPEFSVDLTKYNRVTITAKAFNAAGEELPGADSQIMVTMVSDTSDWKPEHLGSVNQPASHRSDGNRNIILKEFNVGGYSDNIGKDRGVRVRMTQNPQALLFQVAQGFATNGVRFIEITSLVFHTGNYSTAE